MTLDVVVAMPTSFHLLKRPAAFFSKLSSPAVKQRAFISQVCLYD
jgi:hypothetical protein